MADELVETAVERARRAAAALDARIELEPLPIAGRTAIVVDDGLITGLTLAAACRWARAEDVLQLIAATPVGRRRRARARARSGRQVVCPHALEMIAVVGQAYDSFDPLDEWYVSGLLMPGAPESASCAERRHGLG